MWSVFQVIPAKAGIQCPNSAKQQGIRLRKNERIAMPELDLASPMPPLVIGATGHEAIAQNIRVIVTTLAFSVALDRAFANTGSFIDAPTPHAVALKIAELTEAIEAQEPRVTVTGIRFAPRADEMQAGRLFPVITYRVKDSAAKGTGFPPARE